METPLDTAGLLLEKVFHVPLTVLSSEEDGSLEAYLLWPTQMPPMKDLLQKIDSFGPMVVLLLTDYAGATWGCVRNGTQYVFVGPFRLHLPEQASVKSWLAACGQTNEQAEKLIEYHIKLPLMNQTQLPFVLNALQALMHMVPEVDMQRLILKHEVRSMEEDLCSPLPHISHVQDPELQFMSAVYFGNTEDAFENLRLLQMINVPHDQVEDGKLLVQDISGFAILRTLARVAAKYAGVSIMQLDQICSRYRNDNFMVAHNGNVLAFEMTSEICQAVREQRIKPYSPLIQQTINAILSGFQHPLTVKQLAADIGTNSTYLSNRFHQEVGCNLIAYINQTRLEYARMLLVTEATNIKLVSSMAGFNSQSYFTKLFKKKYGLPPKQYASQRLGWT